MLNHLVHQIAAFVGTFAFEVKLATASIIGMTALLADIVREANGWEDVSLKVLLIITIIFVVRLLLKQQAEHKVEREQWWAAFKVESEAREQKMSEALDSRAESLQELVSLTREQVDFHRSVTRHLVNERINRAVGQLP